MSGFTLRRAQVADAEAITRTVQVAQAYTYAAIMPAQFAIDRITEIPAMVKARRAELARDTAAEAAGREPFRRWWIAEHADGEAVAAACAGRGPCAWEADFAPAPVDFQLERLYALPRAHGSGIGQRLLEAAVPEGEPAYLWILRGNPRAERFYRRNGFVPDGYAITSGPKWFERPMFRMVRPAA